MEILSRRMKQESETLLPRHALVDVNRDLLLAKNEALPQPTLTLASGIAGPESLFLLS